MIITFDWLEDHLKTNLKHYALDTHQTVRMEYGILNHIGIFFGGFDSTDLISKYCKFHIIVAQNKVGQALKDLDAYENSSKLFSLFKMGLPKLQNFILIINGA